jgi:hypothetical protein
MHTYACMTLHIQRTQTCIFQLCFVCPLVRVGRESPRTDFSAHHITIQHSPKKIAHFVRDISKQTSACKQYVISRKPQTKKKTCKRLHKLLDTKKHAYTRARATLDNKSAHTRAQRQTLGTKSRVHARTGKFGHKKHARVCRQLWTHIGNT